MCGVRLTWLRYIAVAVCLAGLGTGSAFPVYMHKWSLQCCNEQSHLVSTNGQSIANDWSKTFMGMDVSRVIEGRGENHCRLSIIQHCLAVLLYVSQDVHTESVISSATIPLRLENM